jgi:NitT/TauT family transport system substrate-binding protein
MAATETHTTIEKPRASRRPLSRRRIIALAGALGAATPFAFYGRASALAGLRAPSLGDAIDEFPICRTAASEPANALKGAPRRLKLAWNASSVCTSAAPVAKERGIFAKYNLDVEFVNFGGSTEQLLEAIATGKADAGIGMALRWLKPLEQGFDVRITAGVHGGCMRLLGAKATGVDSIESIRGKAIAISDQASPEKNFFSILLAKKGINPVKDVEWRQYPLELLALAVEKGEVQALAGSDPLASIWLKAGKLNEVATRASMPTACAACSPHAAA